MISNKQLTDYFITHRKLPEKSFVPRCPTGDNLEIYPTINGDEVWQLKCISMYHNMEGCRVSFKRMSTQTH